MSLSAIFGNPGSAACAVFARAGVEVWHSWQFHDPSPHAMVHPCRDFQFWQSLAIFGDSCNSRGPIAQLNLESRVLCPLALLSESPLIAAVHLPTASGFRIRRCKF